MSDVDPEEPPPPPPPEPWELRDVRDFNQDWAKQQHREFEVEWEKARDEKQFLPAPEADVIHVSEEWIELRFLKRSGGLYRCVPSKDVMLPGSSKQKFWVLSWTPPKIVHKLDDRMKARSRLINEHEFAFVRLNFGMAFSSNPKVKVDDMAGDLCSISATKPSMRRFTIGIPQSGETRKKLEQYLQTILAS